MSTKKNMQALALKGGMKAVSGFEGKGKPKIGIEEFVSICERFGFSKMALQNLRNIAETELEAEGPFLANYYSGLRESKVQAFERVAREIFGSKYAIGTSSGTGALHAAFVAAGVGPGTEVICPAIGFFATAAAVVMSKGIPVFCDVDESLNMDPAKIEPLITPRTVAIAPTHVMGTICDMAPIMKLARKYHLKVIEDCAQSCGASYKGTLVGTIGDIGCFSISAYKIVGGGEGGLVLTNGKSLWERASNLVECGGLWRPERFAKPRRKGELFCGTNYRMSELEAAVDVPQLKKVSAVVRRFRTVRKRMLSGLKAYTGITPQKINDIEGEIGYLLRFFTPNPQTSKRVAKALQAEGINCSTRGTQNTPDWHIYSYMYPLTGQESPDGSGCPFNCDLYKRKGGKVRYDQQKCPIADDLFQRVIDIPLNQWYTPRDCRIMADGINKVLGYYFDPNPNAPKWC